MVRPVRHFLTAMMLLLVTACGSLEWPPKNRAGVSNRPAESGETSPVFSGASAVKVGKGDTVYALSRRHGVSPRAIIEANNLRAPYYLEVGQRIILPRARHHTVARHETLYGISRVYGVDTYELARANNLPSPYRLAVGQRLTIPGHNDKGETVSTAAAQSTPPKRPTSRIKDQSRLVAIPKVPASTGKGFVWPVKGKVISRFGAKQKGLHNDGINIQAPRGTPVKAIENGVVVYAGNEIKGFGNLLLIKHADGWVSAYAHNDKLLVTRGRKVKKGQVISKIGSTGSVKTPQLHFELRKGRKAKDPQKYLRG